VQETHAQPHADGPTRRRNIQIRGRSPAPFRFRSSCILAITNVLHRIRDVSRFWLTYRDLAGRLTGVVILDSPRLLLAGLQVMSEGLDRGMTFREGHELDGDAASLIAPDLMGRMLSREETAQLIHRLEQVIPKRPAAASVRRSIGSERDDDAA
jgi:hypothetical protein